jgi:hypothetical protein
VSSSEARCWKSEAGSELVGCSIRSCGSPAPERFWRLVVGTCKALVVNLDVEANHIDWTVTAVYHSDTGHLSTLDSRRPAPRSNHHLLFGDRDRGEPRSDDESRESHSCYPGKYSGNTRIHRVRREGQRHQPAKQEDDSADDVSLAAKLAHQHSGTVRPICEPRSSSRADRKAGRQADQTAPALQAPALFRSSTQT